jgi:hypothetical protein
MTRFQDRASECANGPPCATPALATTMSILPNRSPISRATCSMASLSVTSACQWPESVGNWSETRFSSSGSRPTSAILVPRAASLRASNSPMPRAPPVTTATRPSRLLRGLTMSPP